jgi:hypothetical protein
MIQNYLKKKRVLIQNKTTKNFPCKIKFYSKGSPQPEVFGVLCLIVRKMEEAS